MLATFKQNKELSGGTEKTVTKQTEAKEDGQTKEGWEKTKGAEAGTEIEKKKETETQITAN